jgi:hypothetical protein
MDEEIEDETSLERLYPVVPLLARRMCIESSNDERRLRERNILPLHLH